MELLACWKQTNKCAFVTQLCFDSFNSHWSCISMQATFDKDGKLQVRSSESAAAMA